MSRGIAMESPYTPKIDDIAKRFAIAGINGDKFKEVVDMVSETFAALPPPSCRASVHKNRAFRKVFKALRCRSTIHGRSNVDFRRGA